MAFSELLIDYSSRLCVVISLADKTKISVSKMANDYMCRFSFSFIGSNSRTPTGNVQFDHYGRKGQLHNGCVLN